MILSRKITFAFIGVFLIGALVGGLVVWNVGDNRLTKFMSNATDPQSMAARINQKYGALYQLTPDQQTKIGPLVQEMAQHIYQERRQFGVDILNTLDEYHAKIAAEMTPDQRQAYEKANQERKLWMSKALLLEQTPPPQ